MAKMGDNKEFFERFHRNISAGYAAWKAEAIYTTKDIHERTGWKIDTIKGIITSVVRGVVGSPWQQGKMRLHTPNEVFLIVLTHHLTFNLGVMAREAQEIVADIYPFLIKEKLLPSFSQRKSEYYQIENGGIYSGHDDEGEEKYSEVSNPEYFSMDIQIMRSVKREDKAGRFYYKTYQLVSHELENKDGVEFHITKSIEGEIIVDKPGDFKCDNLTVLVLPITDLLTKFRHDFNCPGPKPDWWIEVPNI